MRVGPNGKTPALLTRMSTWPPPRSVARRASARTEAASARSAAMKSAFPQVYLFPAKESQNVVIIGTRSAEKFSYVTIQERSVFLIQSKRVTLPNFRERASSFRIEPPPNWQGCPLLTDDFAPMEGLLRTGSQ